MNNNTNLDTIEVINDFNQKMTGFKHDYITEEIHKYGFYSKPALNLFKEILLKTENAVVLDIGANIGNHSLYFSKYAQRIYAFEPAKAIFSLLQKNIDANCIKNISAFNFGLSNDNIEQNFYFDLTGNCGGSSLYPSFGNFEKQRVVLKNGDDFCKQEQIDRIDLIKIDVEGHELVVLEGLKQTIKKFRPIIFMEFKLIIKHNPLAELKTYLTDCEFFATMESYNRFFWHNKVLRGLRRTFYKKTHENSLLVFPLNKVDLKFCTDILLVPLEKKHLLPPIELF